MVYFYIPRYKGVVFGSALVAVLFGILLLILISISINDTSENFEAIQVLEMINGTEVYFKKGRIKSNVFIYFIRTKQRHCTSNLP